MLTLDDKLLKTEQQLNRLHLHLAKERIKKRKADAHNKIQLGGLVIKAHMENHPKDVLLGALLYCKKQMQVDPKLSATFKKLGTAAMCQSKGEDNEQTPEH